MKKETHISYDYFRDRSELSSLEQQLLDRAKEARAKAYAPYSNFLVDRKSVV